MLSEPNAVPQFEQKRPPSETWEPQEGQVAIEIELNAFPGGAPKLAANRVMVSFGGPTDLPRLYRQGFLLTATIDQELDGLLARLDDKPKVI